MPQKPRTKKSKAEGFTLRPGADELTASGAASPLADQGGTFDDLGELPRTYEVDTIFLIAQEPHWLFTYWDIDIARHPGGATYLRYHQGDGSLEGEIEVPFEARNWYVAVQQAACEYFVELGFYRGKTWNLIARSMTVKTPPDGMTTSEDFAYATVPFHLSFQRMLDQLENARQSGEDLLTAMSRLQKRGQLSGLGAPGMPDLLSEDQRALLQTLLGKEMLTELSSGGHLPAELESLIRAHLEEQLSSGGASEFLSSFRHAAGGFSGDVLSSETLAGSWELRALSSWAAQAVTSSWGPAVAGLAGSALSSGELAASWASSGGSSAGWSSGQRAALAAGSSSWAAAVGSSWGGVLASSWGEAARGLPTSWTEAASSSWTQASSSSWLQAGQSSWAQAALSSWDTAEVSSWFQAAATTSWAGGSETLSSFGSEREFFMHVNAEVIFYGGTDPRASVTVDGQPIALAPDGTFRYHFVFPNADYEVPIVATSPDGVETRSATLRLQRATAKVGHVTDTAQPPLGEPMGRTA